MSDNSSATATTLSSPAVGAAPTTQSVDSVLATGHGSPGSLRLELAVQTPELFSDDNGIPAVLRQHPRIAQLLSIYSSVVLVSVRAYVWQTSVFSSSAEAHRPALIRFGIVPRGITLQGIDAKGTTQTLTPFIPSLRCFATTVNQTATAEAVWGEGGSPFPPGLQLDLAAVEVRHHYPEFLLANAGAMTRKATKEQVKKCETADRIGYAQAQLDVVVECTGQNFGAVF